LAGAIIIVATFVLLFMMFANRFTASLGLPFH
jgi:hypothetical protein